MRKVSEFLAEIVGSVPGVAGLILGLTIMAGVQWGCNEKQLDRMEKKLDRVQEIAEKFAKGD
jgi:hypothetical protein